MNDYEDALLVLSDIGLAITMLRIRSEEINDEKKGEKSNKFLENVQVVDF